MLSYRSSLVVGPFLAIALFLSTAQSWAQELAEGVAVATVATYPVDLPGIEKVELRKWTLEPGAILKDLKIKDQFFCNVTQGVILIVDQESGASTLYAAGSRWAPVKGSTVTISNPGDVTHVHWVYAMIAKM